MRWLLTLVAASVLVVGGSNVAHADPAMGAVSVTGAVHHPTTLTLDGLRALPSQPQTVTFNSSEGPQVHTYVGAPLVDIVTAADPNVDLARKHPLLAVAVVATGADGYSAVISWGELSPELAGTPVLVAYVEDGQPLDRPTLVVPGDVEGARYVSELTELRVVDLAPS